MCIRRTILLSASLCLAAACSSRGQAEEPTFEFLRALEDRGYGEATIDYLEQLRAAKRLPKSLVELYDLELSRSYRLAVAEAFNATEADARQAKAQDHLDKFLKEHPEHPEVARAMESWGDLALDRGLARLRQASAVRDQPAKDKLLTAARADFVEATPRFADATTRYGEQFARLKKAAAGEGNRRAKSAATMTKKQRDAEQAARNAEMAWLECRLKLAKLDFYTAEIYADAASPERKKSLEAAMAAFDAVFQTYRESLVGLHAHLWHGRAADELGQDLLALDVYDEVLASAPDGRERDQALEPLFAQAQYYRLKVLLRKEGRDAFLAEADSWLQARRAWRRLDGYQGVLLLVAKENLHHAGELSGEKKNALVKASLATLADVAKVRGEHQQEAIVLRREHGKGSSGPVDPATVKTFDEALALGEAAMETADWPGAAALFTRALEFRSTVKDADRIAETELRLDQARYQLAATDFAAGKFAESLTAARQIVETRPKSPTAPSAASLSVSSALALYARAEDKPAALAQLETLAADTISRWPDKPEADDSRIALGQACLVRGELAEAIAAFDKVNPRSLRYGIAMHLSGQTRWRMYLAAKARTAGEDDRAALDPQRAQVRERLETSLAAQRRGAEGGIGDRGQLAETELLLAEVLLEAGNADDAAQLVEPLAESLRAAKPKPLDNTHLRTLLAASRAAAAQDKLAAVAANAGLTVELSDDAAAANGVLNTLLKLLVDGWKQAEADAIEARAAGDAARRSAAETQAAERKQLVGELTARLSTRKANSLSALIYIGDTAAQLEQSDTARTLYQSILAQAENDATFRQANGPALTRIQSQLVGLLRQQGQFAEGLKQVEGLIEKFPNALEPKMEKGRLLQAWADVEPAKFAEAVAHWTALRTRLSRVARKPPEYYEVVYNAASCLFTESLKQNNPQKALQAEQLLNATLVLSPKLTGPELVARYKELLAKSRQLQGRPAAAAAKP